MINTAMMSEPDERKPLRAYDFEKGADRPRIWT